MLSGEQLDAHRLFIHDLAKLVSAGRGGKGLLRLHQGAGSAAHHAGQRQQGLGAIQLSFLPHYQGSRRRVRAPKH